jgi:plasmid replication initiation protein
MRSISVKDNLVVKKNDLLRLGYTLSLNEQRILLACISMIDSRRKLEENHLFEITVQQLSDIFADQDAKHLYKDMRLAVDRLFNRTIVIDHGNKIGKLRWVINADFPKDNSKIFVRFHPDIIPLLTEITDRFTRYKLKDVSKFKCIYSFRLYELFAQFQGTGSREIEVSEIRRLLDLGDKYQQFGELKRCVIDKAISEINQFSNLQVNYGTRNLGRRVTHVQFRFEAKPITKPKNPSLTVDEFVRLNPAKTKGKTLIEVQKMMSKS